MSLSRYDPSEGKYTVYLVSPVPAGDVKIGVSSNPDKRLSTLQTGHSCHLTMEDLLYFDTKKEALAVEKSLHEEFSAYRKKGEWFDNFVLNLIGDHIKSTYGE